MAKVVETSRTSIERNKTKENEVKKMKPKLCGIAWSHNNRFKINCQLPKGHDGHHKAKRGDATYAWDERMSWMTI